MALPMVPPPLGYAQPNTLAAVLPAAYSPSTKPPPAPHLAVAVDPGPAVGTERARVHLDRVERRLDDGRDVRPAP